MNVLLFNGAPDNFPNSTSDRISNHIAQLFKDKDIQVTTYSLAKANLPSLDMMGKTIPESVAEMCRIFTSSDIQIWLSPLYHGGIPGTMKNCLDWLEMTSKYPKPYLSGQIVGLVCWSDGIQAMQGINNMDAVAKALRAWVLPYAVPVSRADLYTEDGTAITNAYTSRFKIMADLMISTGLKFELPNDLQPEL